MSRILGIDLGTTNSAVAVVDPHGVPKIIPNREGEYVTPSVVFFEGEMAVVGSQAKHSAVLDPENVVQFVKRQMGNQDWSFLRADGEAFGAEEISALILRRLKEDAEAYLGEPCDHAVITVPAYFQEPQRNATIQAGTLAGLRVEHIVNEPTAAALAYGLQASDTGRVVVYDLGGGTFDVTVLQVSPTALDVLASGGDRSLGGVDWDNRLSALLNERFQEAGGPDLLDGTAAEEDLRERAEAAKKHLSQMSSAKVALSAQGVHKAIQVTREEFEALTRDLLDRTQVLLEETLEEAGLRWPEVDKLLLVGGSTRLPAVVRMIEELLGRPPSRELHPDEVVALGAALQASIIERKQAPPEDRGSLPVVHTAAGVDLGDIRISDVTSHGLGLQLLHRSGGHLYNQVVVERNMTLPHSEEYQVSCLFDGQDHWDVKVTQGDDESLDLVTVIGESTVSFPPKQSGHPLTARFEYDGEGIIHLRVSDGVTEEYYGELHIERQNNLSEAELDDARRRLGNVAVG